MFAFASWLAPSIVIAIGPRLSMILAALTYAFQISQYLYLNAGSVYFASVLIGLGAPIIWTAQVGVNSDLEMIGISDFREHFWQIILMMIQSHVILASSGP